jgi:sphingolipid delta-4 desaturase
MNIKGLDPDLPTQLEINLLSSFPGKLLNILMMPFVYSLRPLFVHSKAPNFFEILNVVAVFYVDYLCYTYISPAALGWLLIGSYCSLTVHWTSGHLIGEHFEFLYRMETYDYFGWANYTNLNLGYHMEHHDFPMIPWTRLPILRKMAPEYYEHLPHHTSYLTVWFRYLVDNYMGPYSRISREGDKAK